MIWWLGLFGLCVWVLIFITPKPRFNGDLPRPVTPRPAPPNAQSVPMPPLVVIRVKPGQDPPL